jgi:membrane associated rhomboid family serine protease
MQPTNYIMDFFAHDNVAHFAHLGGLVVGIIIMLFWKRNKTFFF